MVAEKAFHVLPAFRAPRSYGLAMRPRMLRYGNRPGQFVEVWTPTGAPRSLIGLIHGGFWRARVGRKVMHPLAKWLSDDGHLVVNLEYRRVGRGGGGGGVPATLLDVAAGLDLAAALRRGHEPAPPFLGVGHSAGGHLAMWAASRGRLSATGLLAAPAADLDAALSLCGAVDLDAALEADLGTGAARDFLGMGPGLETRLELAAPTHHFPLGVRQVCFHGLEDTVVPASMSEDYAARARASGDDAVFVGLPGAGHRDPIDPSSNAFAAVVAEIERLSLPRGTS